jgi:hypothetical protein
MVDKYIRKLFSVMIVLLVVLPNFIIPVSATTEAVMIFNKDVGSQINSVDVNMDGTLTFAGLENGSIICMDRAGEIVYNVLATGSGNQAIEKLESDDNGYVAYLNKNGDTGIYSPAGVLLGYHPANPAYFTNDISIGKTNEYWFSTYNSSSVSSIYGFYGADFPYQYSSTSPQFADKVAYDSVNNLVVTINKSSNQQSNRVYLYNISNYTGWLNFNPTMGAKNSTQILLDSFPYRQNISFNNGDTNTVSLRFIDSPTATNVTNNGNGTFTYNTSKHGQYFLWTYAYNISTPQQMLNLSTYNATLKQLIISTKPTTFGDNLTFYFGRSDYTNEILTGMDNTTADFTCSTNSSGWTAPTNTRYIYKINVTGGGGGGTSGSHGGANLGYGGNASIPTSGTYGNTVCGTYFAFTIGSGGAGGVGGIFADGASGGDTTAFGLTSAGGSGAGHTATPGAGVNNLRMPGDWGSPGLEGVGSDVGMSGGGYSGGTGYGAGGGGGGWGDITSGSGGKGASGAVNFTYQTWTYSYFNGTVMNSPVLKIEENVNISVAMLFVANLSLTGNVKAISIPEGGGIVGITTDGNTPSSDPGNVYHQEITQTGFGSQATQPTATGASYAIATSDGATYSIEARGSKAQIYDLAGTLKGDYATGGTVNSVDIAARNGLVACSGGNDGIFYIFDKLTTSDWEVYYQGDSASPILSVAISETGGYAAVGRANGLFEYYNVQSDVASAEQVFSADLFVTKGGTAYSNINVSIVEMTNSIPSLITGTNITSKTDSNGHYVFTVTEKRNYLININDGEHTQTYQASPTYKTISINLAYPLMTRAYQYGATYNDTTHTITSTYTDVNDAYLNISIIDTASKTLINSQIYPSTRSVVQNYVVPDANKSYKVQFDFTRTTGAKYSDTIYLQSSLFNQIPKNTSDQYTLFIYAIYTLVLMVVSLSIGTQSLKYGTVMLVALTFLGITLGFLPLSLYSVGIATSAFIALLEVYRRRE